MRSHSKGFCFTRVAGGTVAAVQDGQELRQDSGGILPACGLRRPHSGQHDTCEHRDGNGEKQSEQIIG
ncbi:hypothetical protein [Streptomyces olivaceus]|uniref:hypothetical protein n=1 Tax=Streptomyces olivaceus TaxID=47716 RepID=UPI0036CB6661